VQLEAGGSSFFVCFVNFVVKEFRFFGFGVSFG
jgi:hypothetical protein